MPTACIHTLWSDTAERLHSRTCHAEDALEHHTDARHSSRDERPQINTHTRQLTSTCCAATTTARCCSIRAWSRHRPRRRGRPLRRPSRSRAPPSSSPSAIVRRDLAVLVDDLADNLMDDRADNLTDDLADDLTEKCARRIGSRNEQLHSPCNLRDSSRWLASAAARFYELLVTELHLCGVDAQGISITRGRTSRTAWPTGWATKCCARRHARATSLI